MSQRIVAILKGLISCLIGNRICILMYHNISSDPTDQLAVSRYKFIEQMDWLKHHEYCILTLSQALKDIQTGKIRRKSIVLSFDDGYSDFLEIVVPVLKNHAFPATLFVLAEEAGNISHWKSSGLQEPLLSWEEIRKISDMGHEIGSHGIYHRDLSILCLKDIEIEVTNSKEIIENKIEKPVNTFSYPFGKHNIMVEEAVKSAGYNCAVRVGSILANGPETNPFRLQRIKMEQIDTLRDFVKKIKKHSKLFQVLLYYFKEKFLLPVVK
jgi:peptidoglycan/xylan/chitin deacetylase (PgdA/CDA1 family)